MIDLDKTPKPLVSVIMPTYNGAEFIYEAIKSILDQSYTRIELFVVDDGSTDGTSAIVKSFTDKRLTYIKKPINSGISDSLNVGISMANGKYMARMDDDDVSVKNRISKQVAFLEAHPDVVVCATNDQNLGGERPYLNDVEIRIGLLFGNVMIHASVMMPMDVFKNHKYDVNMVPAEDYDLWSRILNMGKFHKLKEPLMQIRYAKDGQTATRRHEQLQLNIDIFKRIYNYYGFSFLKDTEYIVKPFIEHDYSITGKQLLKLISWMDDLKEENKKLNIFPDDLFCNEIEFQKGKFLQKFFINRKLIHKIWPFILLPFYRKLQVIDYYLKKNNKK